MRTDILEQAKAIRAATLRALGHITEDNERLRVSVLYPRWTAGSHAAGDIYTAEGQVWECHQAYDNAAYPDIVPGGAAWGTFNRPLHGTSPETARPFVAPTGAHDIYKAGGVHDAGRCALSLPRGYGVLSGAVRGGMEGGIMTEAIIVAALGLAGTLIGSYLANRKITALIVYRLEQLEKKVDKHNSVVERTYALEEAVSLLDERVKVANHRITDLEKAHKMGQD